MVYGHNVRTPLDNLVGWKDDKQRKLSTSSWVENLCEHLELMREIALFNSLSEVMKTKRRYDKNSVKRSFEEGSKVLYRIPGMIPKLQDAWEGPFVVKHKLSAVNYRIAE